MNQKWKKPRARRAKTQAAKLSKPMKLAVTRIVKGNTETKTVIRNPVSQPLVMNSNYNVLNGDVFSVPQGTGDSTLAGSANRIGDLVKSSGFKLNYQFTLNSQYSGLSYPIPYMNVRVVVCQLASPLSVGGAPNTNGVLDQGPLGGPAGPLNNLGLMICPTMTEGKGFVKRILYDKVITMRNVGIFVNNGTTATIMGSHYRLQKYIKFAHNIKYADQSTVPDETNNPICVGYFIQGTSGTPIEPSAGNTVGNVIGFTQGWYKDA